MTDRDASRIARVLQPLEAFFRVESLSGFALLGATLAALLWANSPWAAAYEALWHSKAAHLVVNDGLMTVFFLLVGLEIRREAHDGVLSERRTAALPLVAALGGVVVPAAIYLLFNTHAQTRAGWAIPTATDIAFAIGALALLGKRVDPALRALLLALAIADDVAAIVIIALFYADGIAVHGLAVCGLGIVGLLWLRHIRAHRASVYFAAGIVLWLGLFLSGLHAVLAGVVVGLVMPHPPANALERRLHPWVAYGVMPLFALANAGIGFTGIDLGNELSTALLAGIVLGLWVGKPLGIVAASALAVRLGWCKLPPRVTWHGIVLIGCLGGIGFTMSIFIATLAFPDPSLLAVAKLAVLAASLLAATTALALGRAHARVEESREVA